MRRILGAYKNIINPDLDEILERELIAILREKNGVVYSIQEINKYYCESHNLYYYLFHCLYGRNALNFTPYDFKQIKEQINIHENDIIIDDFRARKPKVRTTEMFIVSKDFFIGNNQNI
ncbi:hypothetical protein [Priestia megaterium]|uniref:hypothetical protein n=1 Tax=Priestia megaterium TaxID=1404 RepID=UPI00372D4B1F